MPWDKDFDPFTTRNIIDLPELNFDNQDQWSGFRFEAESQDALFALAKVEEPKLPHLRTDLLRLDNLEISTELEPIPRSSASSSDDEESKAAEATIAEEEQDFWKTPDLLVGKQENKLVTWDSFTQAEHNEPASIFATEAGPVTFNALLRACLAKTHNTATKYAKPDVFINALFDLGLGRSSVFFSWNEQSQRFDQLSEDYAISGLSQNALKNIVNQYLDDGARYRRLRRLARVQSHKNSIRVAFQTMITSVVDAVEEIVESSRTDIRSLIQLQSIYLRPSSVLGVFDHLAKEVSSISSGKDLVAATLSFSENIVREEPGVENIVHLLISRLIEPVLRVVEVEVGLNTRNGFDHSQETEAISAILPPSTLKLYHQARDTFLILQEYEQGSRLLHKHKDNNMTLRLNTSFEETAQVCRQAVVYEQDLQGLIVPCQVANKRDEVCLSPASTASGVTSSGHNPFSIDFDLFDQVHSIDKPGAVIHTNGDQSVRQAVLDTVESDGEVSTDMIPSCRLAIDLSVAPLLRAQHRLLSYSVLQILFQKHKFVSHVKLLGRFQLLSDGTFASKLSTSLFDSDQYSGESRRTLGTKTGLRLQNRETWPPASSELRLALMGVLSESMSGIRDDELIDSVSFAIRDLSDEDLEKCRDIDSIYALDFLRLNYKPPSSIIGAIITANSVETYDQIFNQLLRLLRVHTLTQSMLHDANARYTKATFDSGERKFKVRAQQFVGALADYCHNSVIRTLWQAFENRATDIESRLKRSDYLGTLELTQGLDHLREIHEEVIDQLSRGLLLKRKQSEAKGIIDRLFEVILRFAALTSKAVITPGGTTSINEVTKTTIPRLHKDFDMHMKALVRWLRAESARADNGNAQMLEQLLLRLDWNGYWSK